MNYLSKEKQAEIMPTFTGIKVHNAKMSDYSRNRDWTVEFDYHQDPDAWEWITMSDHQKTRVYKNSCYNFTNKADALKFIKTINDAK